MHDLARRKTNLDFTSIEAYTRVGLLTVFGRPGSTLGIGVCLLRFSPCQKTEEGHGAYEQVAWYDHDSSSSVCGRWARAAVCGPDDERAGGPAGRSASTSNHAGHDASARQRAAQTAPRAASAQAAPDALPQTIAFNRDIRPILSDKCFKCHGPGTQMATVRFDLEDGAKHALTGGRFAVVPGDPDNSQMIKRITATNPAVRMPKSQEWRGTR